MATIKRKLIDLSGQTFGRLTVLNEGPRMPRRSLKVRRITGERTWNCLCSCGKQHNITHGSLVSGNGRSCGCLERDLTIKRNHKHGHASRAFTSPEYDIWCGIIKRCTSPRYKNYHGRGIQICPRWRDSFEAFYADMGPRPSCDHSIERIENDGDYTPNNCRWATRTEQAHNKRNNRWITYNGETLCWTDWGRRLNTSAGTIQGRLRAGWSIERTLTQPVKRR